MRKTITLVELITWLKKCPSTAAVKFSNGQHPGGLYSYRGNYADLAIEHYPPDTGYISVERLLSHAQDCVGKTFLGYKGGEFVMNERTNVWYDN
jgi:hypothetical protein